MLLKSALSAVDRGCVDVLVMLHLTAALRTIDHDILLSRLTHSSIHLGNDRDRKKLLPLTHCLLLLFASSGSSMMC